MYRSQFAILLSSFHPMRQRFCLLIEEIGGEGVFTTRSKETSYFRFSILPLCSTGVRVERTSWIENDLCSHLFVKIEDLFEERESCIGSCAHDMMPAPDMLSQLSTLNAHLSSLLYLHDVCFLLFPRTRPADERSHQPCIISFSF